MAETRKLLVMLTLLLYVLAVPMFVFADENQTDTTLVSQDDSNLNTVVEEGEEESTFEYSTQEIEEVENQADLVVAEIQKIKVEAAIDAIISVLEENRISTEGLDDCRDLPIKESSACLKENLDLIKEENNQTNWGEIRSQINQKRNELEKEVKLDEKEEKARIKIMEKQVKILGLNITEEELASLGPKELRAKIKEEVKNLPKEKKIKVRDKVKKNFKERTEKLKKGVIEAKAKLDKIKENLKTRKDKIMEKREQRGNLNSEDRTAPPENKQGGKK